LLPRLCHRNTSVIDQNINFPEGIACGDDHGFDTCFIADIRMNSECLSAIAFNLEHCVMRRVLVAHVCQRNANSQFSVGKRNSASDALAATGDEGDLAS
jgi:hypothetical protein